MPTPARVTFSEPGAPGEPQRTSLRVGLGTAVPGLVLRAAKDAGLLGQEGLEATFVELEGHRVVPLLVAGEIEVGLMDLATFAGERSLGWDGHAIGALGPSAEDRSVSVLAVEAATLARRSDLCERLVRATSRSLARLAAEGGFGAAQDAFGPAARDQLARAGLAGWWQGCRPGVEELREVVRWAPGGLPAALRRGRAWAP